LNSKIMQRGFTLIELVVVLSIVAVLAGIALPRMVNLQRDARIGQLQGVRGSIVSGATLIHSAMLARRGLPDAAPCPGGGGAPADNLLTGAGTACTEGGLVQTMHGYPAATAQGILSASGLGTSFNPTATDLAADGYRITIRGNSTTIERIDAPSPTGCSFIYTEPVQSWTAPIHSPLITSGC
jgi:MSHA pilin protein MshA